MATALVPLAPGFEELEAVTLIDLLRRADVRVTVAGTDGETVIGSRKTVIRPDRPLADCAGETFDLIALPGGLPGADNLAADQTLKTLITEQHGREGWIAAVCAAPRVLAVHGLLAGRRATGFPGALDGFDLPDSEIVDEPVVVDGHLITSRGPGTAMDCALVAIGLTCGDAVRHKVEDALQRPRHHMLGQLPAH